MGWNSWNTFGYDVTETNIRASADFLVSSGLAALGYNYVLIDDCWAADERVDGKLTWNPVTFSSGIPALADYVHSLGLKLGIYSCSGTSTCCKRPGSYRYEEIDARTFAAWGVDFLKHDHCFFPPEANVPAAYRRMGQALRNSGRDIVYSLANWGGDEIYKWGRSTGGHLWRTTGDIKDSWHSIYDLGFRAHSEHAPYAGPGGWNDLDMLVVGMRGQGNPFVIEGCEATGCTDDEYQTHFALWCLQASPLIIGADLHKLDGVSLAILGNKELIAMNQDPLGVQAKRLGAHDNVEAWSKPLANGDIAVGFFNLGLPERKLAPVSWESLGLADTTECRVVNVLTGEDRGVHTRSYSSCSIRTHACEVVRITPA